MCGCAHTASYLQMQVLVLSTQQHHEVNQHVLTWFLQSQACQTGKTYNMGGPERLSRVQMGKIVARWVCMNHRYDHCHVCIYDLHVSTCT